MLNDLTPKMKELMQQILPVMREYLETKTLENFETNKERLDFIMSCALNLLGNMTLFMADDLDHMKFLASKTIENLMLWYEQVISFEQRKKEAH